MHFYHSQLFIDPGKLLPLNRFLPKAPGPKGPKKKGPPGGVGGAPRGRGGFGGRGGGGGGGRGGGKHSFHYTIHNHINIHQNNTELLLIDSNRKTFS